MIDHADPCWVSALNNGLKSLVCLSLGFGLAVVAGCSLFRSRRPTPTPGPVDQACAERPTPHPPVRVRASGIKNKRLIPNLAYGSASPNQTLDLLLPSKAKPPYPVVVRIHGGAFQYGDAEWDEKGPAAQAIIDAGYALASVNYRVATEARFPAAARDVKTAVRFLRAKARTYRLDPRRFAAWGESAGGYFAVMLGLTADQRTTFDDPSLGYADQSSAVSAVVDWYGPTDFATMDQDQVAHPPKSCPKTFVAHTPPGGPEAFWLCGSCGTRLNDQSCAVALADSNLVGYVAAARTLPRFAIAHGADDCMVPWGQSQALVDALRRRGAQVRFNKRDIFTHADPRFETADTADALRTIAAAFRR